jgi:hypothetical protein
MPRQLPLTFFYGQWINWSNQIIFQIDIIYLKDHIKSELGIINCMSELWGSIIKQVADYGPFPFGIIVGVWINKWSTSTVIQITKEEKDAIRKEKRELQGIIKAKEDRIDALHDKIMPKN